MTKKHYETIAAIIKFHNIGRVTNIAIKDAAVQLADYFATDNKNFDRTRFLQACGIVE